MGADKTKICGCNNGIGFYENRKEDIQQYLGE
jgi:hypothetical protein